MPPPQYLALSIALYTHLAATLEREELVPACFKEGEIEACSLSSQRDSVRAPSKPHAPEISSAKRENHTVPGWEHAISIPLGSHPLSHLMPVHQSWHNSQARASGRGPCPSPKHPQSCHRTQYTDPFPFLQALSTQHQSPVIPPCPTTAFPCCVFRALPSPWSSTATKSTLRGGWHWKLDAGGFLAAPVCRPTLQALP